MSLNEEVELLRNIPLFAKLEASKLKLLAFTSERLTFQPGQSLFRQGDMGDAAYIIVSGEADVIVDTPKGPLKVAGVRKNDFVGEIAILCDVPRTATITAQSELTTLRISKDLFFRLISEFPQMAVEIMRVLAQRLEKTTADLRDTNARLRQLQGG
ncbi:MAG: cyclic nucleotide-binding domain-containing protein [Alphaproteobacteria bacterium]|nr:cyclic nucleotide-binding domain-containing protein [Alphaproteobacteria bacterium]